MTNPQPPIPPEGPAGGQPGAPVPRRSKITGIVLLVAMALAFAGIGYMAWREGQASPDGAAVGDCVQRDGDSVKVVKCTDAKAEYKIVGKVEKISQVTFSISSGCGKFPEAKTGFWRGEQGKEGYALCLAPVG